MAWNAWLMGAIGGAAGALGVAAAGLFAWRPLARRLFATFMDRLLTDPYERNLLEFVSATRRSGLQTVLENSLRAETGEVIMRPFGTPRRFPHLDQLLFNFAQLRRFPTEESTKIDLRAVIGPQAARPLTLELPLLIAPMAFGFSLSVAVKTALAKAATLAGTAASTGEGALLPEERAAARRLILQYSRASWAKDPETLRQADAIEVQIGLGARGGTGHTIPAEIVDPALRRSLGLPPGEDVASSARMPGIQTVDDLKSLVESLRRAGGGVPVGFKLAAGKELERDLELAAGAGPDFITVSGSQSGSWGSPPALQDDFGLPSLYAIARAGRFFASAGLSGRVSLIVGGGLATPGEFLKALALGADAVEIGTAALFAVAHTQVLKALPWEPPTQLIGHAGSLSGAFDVETGAQSLARFLLSCRDEMAEGVRALGKTSHRQMSREDLMALDPVIAELCGVGTVWAPHVSGTAESGGSEPVPQPGPAPDREESPGKREPAPRARNRRRIRRTAESSLAGTRKQSPWLRPARRPRPLLHG